MLELLKHKTIGIGTSLEVKKHFSFDRSVQVMIKPNRLETISEQLAENIFVIYEGTR
jgi:DtxR family Mn-dependent transcriptional regulator